MHSTSQADHACFPLPKGPASFQQTALNAHFDDFAQSEDDLDAVVQEACHLAARGVGAGFAGILQYRADERRLVLQAGVGWQGCLIGRTRVAADAETTAGLAWLTGQLIHFRKLDGIGRIRIPEALSEQGVCRLVSVAIPGGDGPFGVLEVGSAEPGRFAEHDLQFLRSLSATTAAAISRCSSRAGQAGRAAPGAQPDLRFPGRPQTSLCRPDLMPGGYQQDAQTGPGS